MNVSASLKDKITVWLSEKRLHHWLVALFCIVLSVEYFSFVYSNYSYMGFRLDANPVTIIVGLLFLVIIYISLFGNRKVSSFLYLTAICFGVILCIPSTIMYIFGGVSILCPLYSSLLLILLTCDQLNIPAFTANHASYRWQALTLACIVIILTIPFVINYGFPTNFKVFSLGSEVYDVRLAANRNATLLTSYLFGPLSKILLPTLLITAILHKDFKITTLAVLAMLYLFLVNPHKTLLFSIPVTIAFVFFKQHEAKAGAFLLLLDFTLILSVIMRLTMNSILIESILIRRGFFLPVLISDNYFMFFNNNPMMLSHSILSGLLKYPYAWDPSHLMGFMMHETSATSCNTGIIADGFMNFGHLGVLLWIFTTVFLFKYIDSIGIHHAYFGLVFIFIFTLANSALLTSMLTHGGILLILVLTFLVDRNKDDG